ncbi:MAG: 50S ribosomal protein L32 [Bacteroidetes bacterium]|nr:50S ribosomal protein L32 [Bacteroidota bacterium]
MPHPKRKISKTRRDKRRTHDKATVPPMYLCPECKSPVELHRVCPECGTYRGKKAIEKSAAE